MAHVQHAHHEEHQHAHKSQHRKVPKFAGASKVSGEPPIQVDTILEALTASANTVLKKNLEPFQTSGSGNFPYFYQMPATTQFNGLTYDWISRHVAAQPKTPTTTLSLSNEYFTNLWIEAVSKVTYKYSTADQTILNNAYQKAQIQQVAVLNAWKSAFGTIPPPTPTQQPIDVIMYTIAQTWAVPPTTLMAMQQAPNLRLLLNNAPASGLTMFTQISQYLQALSSAVSLANQGTMYNGYLTTDLTNVQAPSVTNGGLSVSNSTALVPSWGVTDSLAYIVNGLANAGSYVEMNATVSIADSSDYKVSINGGTSFTIPFDWFFTLSVNSQASYFNEQIVSNSQSVKIAMKYPGVTLVSLAPPPMSLSTSQNWYWESPIVNSIKNGTSDVTGFEFSPAPGIDFSENGPFGWLSNLAISTYPTITIVVQSSHYQSIATTISSSTSVYGSFLGIDLFSGTATNYSNNVSVDASSQTVTIVMTPPPQGMGQSVDQNVAWILGASATFTGASASVKASHYQAALAARNKRLHRA